MKILIGCPTRGMSRDDSFYDYHMALDKVREDILPIVTFARGQSPARNRNMIIQQALDNDCSHIMFLDDDLGFASDTLMKLVAHDKDIVGGLYLKREYPHRPIVFDYADEDGRCRHAYLNGKEELMEVVAMGLGCCLIKTHVFRKLEEPWIRLGELEKDHWCDDIGFFLRVREAGFKIYCDTSIKAGHMFSGIVWPTLINGVWHITYDTRGLGTVSTPLPQVQYPELVEK